MESVPKLILGKVKAIHEDGTVTLELLGREETLKSAPAGLETGDNVYFPAEGFEAAIERLRVGA